MSTIAGIADPITAMNSKNHSNHGRTDQTRRTRNNWKPLELLVLRVSDGISVNLRLVANSRLVCTLGIVNY